MFNSIQMLKPASLSCQCVKEDNDAISGNGAFRDGPDAYDNSTQVILLFYKTGVMIANVKICNHIE